MITTVGRRRRIRWVRLALLAAFAVPLLFALLESAKSSYNSSHRGSRRHLKRVEIPAQERANNRVEKLAAQNGNSTMRSSDWLNDDEFKVLITSHGRVMWFWPASGREHVIHRERGIYYGVVPCDVGSDCVYVVSRGTNLNEKNEMMLKLQIDTGTVMDSVELQSHFTHDAIRFRDAVFVADTQRGNIDRYSFPEFKYESSIQPFSRKQHVNTLAATDGSLLCMLYNSGSKSRIVELDMESGEEVNAVDGVGTSAHQLVMWGNHIIMLDSMNGALVQMDRRMRQTQMLWQNKKKFLKGLAVVNNVALFGYSNWGTAQSRLVEHSSLAAFDLLSRRLLWIKEVATHGLLNTVSVPHIAIDSTYRAVYVGYGDAELPIRISKNFPDSPFLLPMPQTAPLLSPIAPHHRTSEETCKNRHREVYHATRERGYDVARLDSNAFYRLPVQVDFKRLDEEISALGPGTLRKDVNNRFTHIATHNGNNEETRMGPFKEFDDVFSRCPYLAQILSALGVPVGRSRTMTISPYQNVNRHADMTHHIAPKRASIETGYWGRRYRLHIVSSTHPDVTYVLQSTTTHVVAGELFVFDNSVPHEVVNLSPSNRTHIVCDIIGSETFYDLLSRALTIHPHTSAVADGSREWNPHFIPYQPHLTVQPLTEPWLDYPVFEAHEHVREYFLEPVMQLVPQHSAKALEALHRAFDEFERSWRAVERPPSMLPFPLEKGQKKGQLMLPVHAPSRKALETFRALQLQLREAVWSWDCEYNTDGSLYSPGASGVADVMAGMIQQLMYECIPSESTAELQVARDAYGPTCRSNGAGGGGSLAQDIQKTKQRG